MASISKEDRALLLGTLRMFRVESDEETDWDYSNRDVLEQKLIRGVDATEFDETDHYVLQSALLNQLPESERRSRLVDMFTY